MKQSITDLVNQLLRNFEAHKDRKLLTQYDFDYLSRIVNVQIAKILLRELPDGDLLELVQKLNKTSNS